MSIIHHKYNAGDVVKFKDKFHSPTCGLVGREGTTAKIAGRALPYNNRPHYYLEGEEAIFPETCFAGLATEPVNSPSRDEAVWADTLQGHETKCDTGDSGEPENLWDVISELSDLRARFNVFDDEERAKYHALSVAIKKLQEA